MNSYTPTKFDRFLYYTRIQLNKNKKTAYTVSFSFLSGMLINTLSAPDLSKNIWDVLKNIFSLSGRPLNILSWLATLFVVLPTILTWATNYHHKKRGIKKIFENLLKNRISPTILSFSRGLIAWDTSLTLQQAPDLIKGWQLDEITFDLNSVHFTIPSDWKTSFENYYRDNYDKKGFKDDGNKYMLTINPSSFTDAPSLKLNLINCKYSQVQFYKDIIATIPHAKNEIIEKMLYKNKIENPHSLCLHLLIITSDQKILLTERSDKVSYYPSTWSASVEEQFHEDDFKNVDNVSPLKSCLERLFIEEIGASNSEYDIKNLRILSVFLESDILNISLAGVLKLNIDAEELRSSIYNTPRKDYEYKNIAFLSFSDVLKEIKYPTRKMHPSGGYRLLLALYHKYGPLKMIAHLMKD